MKKIDTKFNVLWTFIIVLVYILEYLIFTYTPGPRKSETLFSMIENPVTALCLLLFSVLLIVLLVSKIFMEIWNRLISDLFSLRMIGYAESYALCVLFIGIIGGSEF